MIERTFPRYGTGPAAGLSQALAPPGHDLIIWGTSPACRVTVYRDTTLSVAAG